MHLGQKRFVGRRRLIWNACEMDGMLVCGEIEIHAHLRVEATSSDD